MGVAACEAGLAQLAVCLGAEQTTTIHDRPGLGAAGGLGAGLFALCNAQLLSGIDWVLNRSGIDDALISADLAITGEGRVDAESANGKVISGVSERAARAAVPRQRPR